MQITGGKITFQRSVQPAQYETKKAEVELSFTLAEGESLDGLLDQVATLAQAKALEMVGLKPAAAPATTPKPAATTVKEPANTTKPATRTKADLQAEQEAKLNGKTKPATTTVKKPPAAAANDAASMEEVEEPANISTGAERVDPEQVEEASEDDALLGLTGGAVVETITDEELTSAASKHNAKIVNPTAIKQLIKKFCDPSKQAALRMIPQEKRKSFLEALVKL